MKKSNYLSIILATLFTVGGCSNVESALNEPAPSSTTENEAYEKHLQKLLAVAEEKGSAFLTYYAPDGTFDVLDDEQYSLSNAFADLIVKDSKKAPEGPGWKLAGKGKTKVDALKMARTLMQTIPANMNFEIHVEYDNAGTWYVWYRYV